MTPTAKRAAILALIPVLVFLGLVVVLVLAGVNLPGGPAAVSTASLIVIGLSVWFGFSASGWKSGRD